MWTKERVVELLREQPAHLAREFGVRTIGLSGSLAKGQSGEPSDIDLIVEFEHPIGLRFMELVEYLEGLFGRKVGMLTPVGLQSIRRKSVADSITESILHV